MLVDCCAVALMVASGMALAAPALGPRPTAAEMRMRDTWVRQHLARPAPSANPHVTAAPRPTGLMVLANHGGILRNGRPDGRRIKIGDTEYEHGLICHAASKVVVLLPSPGSLFSATVGVDANAGGGSVDFSVRVGAREVYRSGVMRGGDPGRAVSADLGGAREFTIEADDAGDGISSDHADWANATVTLVTGKVIRLADLPEVNPVLPQRIATSPPFWFRYGGQSSDALLSAWLFRETIERVDRQRTRRTQVYSDPESGLEVRCVAVTYRDFPTVEWTVYLRNTGTTDTPIIESLQAMDLRLDNGGSGDYLLHRFLGSLTQARDFQPIEEPLVAGSTRVVTGGSGRPTATDLCYFNVERPGGGVIVTLGWPGQWAARFERDSGAALRVVAGQELTRFVLRPGEEARTPLVALQFWQGGDWVRAQNVWRRWMVAHNLPRPGGRPVDTHYGGCFGNPLPRADEEIAQAEGCARDGVKLDYWFIDAGWYPCKGAWSNVGTWEPDPERFPRGLREVGDALHRQGVQFIVWFEPERATAGTWITENHPEWVLGGRAGGLVDMGNPDARRWITDRVDALITESGIDVYRSDYNIGPLPFWRAHDAADRVGMTENAYVQGFLSFWDELLRRHPGMFIDACASGGTRNDLEVLRRAVPLLRSDWAVADFTMSGAAGQQGQTYALSLWMPYHGTGAPSGDPYVMRSSYCPAFRMGWDAGDPKRDTAMLQRTVAEFRRVAPYMLGDFYPLTPYSLEKTEWIAWQYDRPEKGEGAIQAFRREECADESVRLRPRGLVPGATYRIEDLDGGEPRRLTGSEMMSEGIVVTAGKRPGSVLLLYSRDAARAGAGPGTR